MDLKKRLKQAIKRTLKRLRLFLTRTFLSYGPEELQARLRDIGLGSGDVVFVHSAFDRFEGFQGKPTDVIDALTAVVGDDGTVMMPTMPFTGTAIEYVRSGKVFDVRRSPSRMGLITEIFRRIPECRRSVHPTHPIAARGPLAEELLREHHASETPCGRTSPFGKLLERDGKVLLLGTGIGVLTLFHMIEEDLESDMPFSPFTEKIFVVRSIDARGEELETRTRLYEPSVSKRRNLHILEAELRRAGAWREAKIGRLRMILLEARAVSDTARALADRGTFCYDEVS